MKNDRHGLTLTEMVMVIGIVALLAALLLPAVQMVREGSRRTSCKNNLRQQSLAVQNHASLFGRLPHLYNGGFLDRPATLFDEWHFHSWRVAILPQLEQGALFDRIAQDSAATVVENQANLVVELAVYQCPSTPWVRLEHTAEFNGMTSFNNFQHYDDIGPAARSDYEAVAGLHNIPIGDTSFSNYDMTPALAGAWGLPKYNVVQEIRIAYPIAKLSQVTDGLSQTILIGERSGRPDWRPHGPVAYSQSLPLLGPASNEAAWGVSTKAYKLIHSSERGINTGNENGIFSFHPAIANVAFADGSVRSLSEDVEQAILNAMITRASSDTVSSDQN